MLEEFDDEFELELEERRPRRSLSSSEEFGLQFDELLELELLDEFEELLELELLEEFDERFELRLLDEFDELFELVLPANCNRASPSACAAGPWTSRRPVVRGASAACVDSDAHAAPESATNAPAADAASHVSFFMENSIRTHPSPAPQSRRAGEPSLNARVKAPERLMRSRDCQRFTGCDALAMVPPMPFSRTYDGDEPQRVNKWLAQSGVCSRREAEAYIAEGLVAIDGETVSDPGRKIARGQTLTLRDAALGAQLTVVVHKPVGVVSAHPEPGQTEAAQLLIGENLWRAKAEAPVGKSLPPLGRLDRDSRGLLLLSEDGVLAKAVIGPESTLDKEYLVRVDGRIDGRMLMRLRHGLVLDGRALRRADVEEIGPQRLRFVLTEGRNRQIRRMCEAVGLTVVDLLRIRIGPVELGDLPEGCWRPLDPRERAAMLSR